MSEEMTEFDHTHDRADHAYWAQFCTCGLAEQERTGHYPEHDEWCDVPSPLDDEEDDLWDVLNDTMAARCCDCPSCNHYLPEGEYRPESKCVHRAAVEALMAHAWDEGAKKRAQYDPACSVRDFNPYRQEPDRG